MQIANDRLRSLIEYTKQTVTMRIAPVMGIAQHKQFSLYEEDIRELPGLHLDRESESGIVWLKLFRQTRTGPPPIESSLLSVWCGDHTNPNKLPELRTSIANEALDPLGYAESEGNKTTTKHNGQVELADFAHKATVTELFENYLDRLWLPWAERQKRVIASIELYGKLFALYQQMQGNISDSAIELVWGAGIVVWRPTQGKVEYPLVSRTVELFLNESDMSIEVRPTGALAKLETEMFTDLEVQGVPRLEKAWRDWSKDDEFFFSPFNPESFTGILRSAVTLLHEEGVFWPDHNHGNDRTLPKADPFLKITDSWVLFARPRTSSSLITDLNRFLEHIDNLFKDLPEVVATLVTDPADEHEEISLPAFRGLSPVDGDEGWDREQVSDLYFPMPYNDEQVKAVQLLEVNAGVVVQGPPGTGKTHTIANIICHYLAHGKKVLVTSMKDPALSVVAEKLPAAIRPLAVSLLTSEAEGMKQFEQSIGKIAEEIVRIDKRVYRQGIAAAEHEIHQVHNSIARLSLQIKKWAESNLKPITIEGESLQPYEWAQQVISADYIGWFPDAISIQGEYAPQFTDEDLARLRTARRILGSDLEYLGKHIPRLTEFPSPSTIETIHQDLSRSEQLRIKEVAGEVLELVDRTSETIARAKALQDEVREIRHALSDMEDSGRTWQKSFLAKINSSGQEPIKALIEAVRGEILSLHKARTRFIESTVSLGKADPVSDLEMRAAIENLASGQKPFGWLGLVGKTQEKKQLASITINGQAPRSKVDWKHVLDFVSFEEAIRKVLTKWKAISEEFPLPRIAISYEGLLQGATASEEIDLLYKLNNNLAGIEKETRYLFPEWNKRFVIENLVSILDEVDVHLSHHLVKARLAQTQVSLESLRKTVALCEGPIAIKLRQFTTTRLGNPQIANVIVNDEWAALMKEIDRLLALGIHLATVREVTETIENSGAPNYANLLRSHINIGTIDTLLPDNVLKVWKVKRLATFLQEANGHLELKTLFEKRAELEMRLAKLYQDTVEKRTWLKLAENATPAISAALEAFRRAIKKIGKGTGIRAGRFRADARAASVTATKAIPCWIMPHYRISESLPTELGLFDLVIIDEASQSDLTALPAILRAKKVLIVGDDRQVSPDGIGIEEVKIRQLMERFLGDQVPIFRQQLSPERSIYDLFNVAFSHCKVMLREHFRSVAAIIEYSKREFYHGELRPLRLPKSSERLDPPLVDVFIRDGMRSGKVNHAEAEFIVQEIQLIVEDPSMSERSIGVVSLIGAEQGKLIWDRLNKVMDAVSLTRHKITVGDARTFQGKERDIVFLSMIASPESVKATTQEMMAQRYNVAASRARDRMYLVRSIELDDLSPADELRRNLLRHFKAPFGQSPEQVADLRTLCESPFELEVYDLLTERGYRVIPQVAVGTYRIDLVVEGEKDKRLAIECDGDRYHGPDQWDNDTKRQRILERAGWTFWRCFASTFVMDRETVVQDLFDTLSSHGIAPTTPDTTIRSDFVESRIIDGKPSVQAELIEIE